MKKLLILLSFFYFSINAQTGAFKVTNGSAIQLGYQNYKYLGFGYNSSSPFSNQSQWAIEHWNGGLNFWKPSPSYNQPGSNPNYKLFLTDWGCLGIGMNPNGWTSSKGSNDRLHVDGKVVGSNRFYTWSDNRIKANVQNLTSVKDILLSLRPVSYNIKQGVFFGDNSAKNSFKDSSITNTYEENTSITIDSSLSYGFIAQEVRNILPTLVNESSNSLLSVDYAGLTPFLIKGYQEQSKTIDSLTLQIQQLRQEIINWKGRSIDSSIQNQTRLFQNNPNPFRGNTEISYYIDELTNFTTATIDIRNIMGVIQSTIVLGDKSGLGKVIFNGSNLTDGYYIYSLKIDGSVKDSKMFLIGD